jgi:heme-degrading monooxygenase HmoA
MFACSFIFTPGTYDEEFYRLDKLVMDYAEAMPGYLGADRWFSEDGLSKNVIYYFKDQESVREFATFSDHKEAKEKYARWYKGYQVVISEVKASYGDGNYPHVTRNQ